MRSCTAPSRPATHRIRTAAWAIALALAFTASEAARAQDLKPPDVPPELRPPSGNVVFLAARGIGTQNYVCLPSTTSATGFDWSLFTPQATLFVGQNRQVTTHFFGPNPDEAGTIRAAWQHSRDTSTVWASLFANPVTVTPDAIPWLLLETAGVQRGPTGGDALTATSFIQRVNTVGGLAPATGCSTAADVGARRFVPYEADYVFYRPDRHRG